MGGKISNDQSNAFKNYLRIKPFFLELIQKDNTLVSDYWAEEMTGFDYMFDAPPSIINNLRNHCYHITGEFSYKYRSHHNYNSNKLKSKLDLLSTLINPDSIISEPKELGGFGYDFGGSIYNLDTLKYI
jgi:hypothetical protein